MPDVWTHIICGREVLDRVEEGFRRMAGDFGNLFYLGCQGPDLFYYHNFLDLGGRDGGVYVLGSTMHHQKCGQFFRESLKYLKNNYHPRTAVYLMALLCHWCLDRATHPYINYISGVYREGGGQSKKLINNHKRVEAAIDVILGQRALDISVRREPAHRRIFVGDGLPAEILSFYHSVLPLVYRDIYERLKQESPDGRDFIDKSYRDMISALRVLHDPRGVKWALASIYDRLVRGSLNLRYYFYRAGVKSPEAYLNEERRPWRHPADAGEVRAQSFSDLFRLGVEDACGVIALSLAFVRGEAGEEELAGKIEDISYSTGKPESDGMAMINFGPVLEGEERV